MSEKPKDCPLNCDCPDHNELAMPQRYGDGECGHLSCSDPRACFQKSTKSPQKNCDECQFETTEDYLRTMGYSSHSMLCSRRSRIADVPPQSKGWVEEFERRFVNESGDVTGETDEGQYTEDGEVSCNHWKQADIKVFIRKAITSAVQERDAHYKSILDKWQEDSVYDIADAVEKAKQEQFEKDCAEDEEWEKEKRTPNSEIAIMEFRMAVLQRAKGWQQGFMDELIKILYQS